MACAVTTLFRGNYAVCVEVRGLHACITPPFFQTPSALALLEKHPSSAFMKRSLCSSDL